MAIRVSYGRMVFGNGATVERSDLDDGSTQWTVTPGPHGELPPGYPAAFPGATVNPAP